MDIDTLDKLIYEARLLGDIKDRFYYLFSKSGFTERLKARAMEIGVRLVTLDDLYSVSYE